MVKPSAAVYQHFQKLFEGSWRNESEYFLKFNSTKVGPYEPHLDALLLKELRTWSRTETRHRLGQCHLGPTVSLFLDLSAGTLCLHLFTIHHCYLDNSAINKTFLFRQAYGPALSGLRILVSHLFGSSRGSLRL